MDSFQFGPIVRVRTPYQDKFGVPRQPGLAPSAQGRVIFEPDFRREEAVRGLGGAGPRVRGDRNRARQLSSRIPRSQ